MCTVHLWMLSFTKVTVQEFKSRTQGAFSTTVLLSRTEEATQSKLLHMCTVCIDVTHTDTLTHTIHIPVMEKADRLTGRTIQAVIGLAVSWLCPKHGVRQELWDGRATQQEGSGRGWVGVRGH